MPMNQLPVEQCLPIELYRECHSLRLLGEDRHVHRHTLLCSLGEQLILTLWEICRTELSGGAVKDSTAQRLHEAIHQALGESTRSLGTWSKLVAQALRSRDFASLSLLEPRKRPRESMKRFESALSWLRDRWRALTRSPGPDPATLSYATDWHVFESSRQESSQKLALGTMLRLVVEARNIWAHQKCYVVGDQELKLQLLQTDYCSFMNPMLEAALTELLNELLPTFRQLRFAEPTTRRAGNLVFRALSGSGGLEELEVPESALASTGEIRGRWLLLREDTWRPLAPWEPRSLPLPVAATPTAATPLEAGERSRDATAASAPSQPAAMSPRDETSELSYELLLKMYKGSGGVVEQLSQRERELLRIDTPLLRYLQQLPELRSPRHVFLTGNAGDGKSFAIETARFGPEFDVVLDGSTSVPGDSGDPILGLASRLQSSLSNGKRLVVAINRGQLDRLQRHTCKLPEHSPLRAVVAELMSQARVNVAWPGQPVSAALIDLGLQDTLSEAVLDPLLRRAASASWTGVEGSESHSAFRSACEALQNPELRERVIKTLRQLASSGVHLTLRQLWSTVSFLLTGGRRPGDDRPVSLADSVGARLFSEEAELQSAAGLPPSSDPATFPQPGLALAALTGTLEDRLRDLPGLGLLLGAAGRCSMRTIARAAWTHGGPLGAPGRRDALVHEPYPERDTFSILAGKLVSAEQLWQQNEQVVKQVLQGTYRALAISNHSAVFPAFEVLCYDSRRLEAREAALVATSNIDINALRLAVPRPPPIAAEALGDSWRPPFLLLAGHTSDGRVLEQSTLRLTPRLFHQLLGRSSASAEADKLLLERWLSRLRQTEVARGSGSSFRVSHPGRGSLELRHDSLADADHETWRLARGSSA